MKLKEGERMVDVVTTRNYNMEYWVNAFQIPVDMYLLYMKQRKGRRKARYYRKLERLKVKHPLKGFCEWVDEDMPEITLCGYALTHEDVKRMLKTAEDELQETRHELGYE